MKISRDKNCLMRNKQVEKIFYLFIIDKFIYYYFICLFIFYYNNKKWKKNIILKKHHTIKESTHNLLYFSNVHFLHTLKRMFPPTWWFLFYLHLYLIKLALIHFFTALSLVLFFSSFWQYYICVFKKTLIHFLNNKKKK